MTREDRIRVRHLRSSASLKKEERRYLLPMMADPRAAEQEGIAALISCRLQRNGYTISSAHLRPTRAELIATSDNGTTFAIEVRARKTRSA